MAANTGVLDSTYCHPNITAELPDSINDSADELINLLCSLDYDALWPTIQEYINYDELESLFMQVSIRVLKTNLTEILKLSPVNR